MVRFLIQRPVGVLLFFISLLVAGLVVLPLVPVSLLPNADVPHISVQVDYPNTTAVVLEKNILRYMRDQLANLQHIKKVESLAGNHSGLIELEFEHNTRMDLAEIAVNEKIDRLANLLPADIQRPQVVRSSTADIPVIRLQVVPQLPEQIIEVSELAETILKKRIEQIEGVSLVDVSGKQGTVIKLVPDRQRLAALDLSENTIIQTIRNANQDLGGLSVKDGQYRYFLKLGNSIGTPGQIGNLPVKLPGGSIIPLKEIAAITIEKKEPAGYYLYNGKEGVVITINKQDGSRMNRLLPAIRELVVQLKKEFPRLNFSFTQDQSFLLDAGVSNLYQDILYGGMLTIALLFMFLGNWASPLLMSISIPVSLIITFICFYLFGISFNIISLSGLALGIGMLIDNSIVVIDNINRKRISGFSIQESSIRGTKEVMAPVISQVLTTVAVYAPLILFTGLAGQLVLDQSIALTISLMVSLLAAFVLSPVLYSLLLKRSVKKKKEDTIFYKWIARQYHHMIGHILRYKLPYLMITLAIMPAGIWLGMHLPVRSLPEMEKNESLVVIDWNKAVDAGEGLRRIKVLQSLIQPHCLVTEAEVGMKQFLLQQQHNEIQRAELYYACKEQTAKLQTDKQVTDWLQKNYPEAIVRVIDAPNAFTRLFVQNTPQLEARFKALRNVGTSTEWEGLRRIVDSLGAPYQPGAGMLTEPGIDISLNYEKMALYGVDKQSIENVLKQLFGNYVISELNRFGATKIIRLQYESEGIDADLNNMTVNGRNGQLYPLRTFITTQFSLQPKFISADRSGPYRSIVLDGYTGDVLQLQNSLTRLAAREGYSVELVGRYFEDRQQLKQLGSIFLVVLGLLYVILAIQYEDLVLPVLVMLTIPLGITGGMLLLWITHGTLDIMAAIGFIVILGLIVDDPILKIEVLNRLEKEYRQKGYQKNDALLAKMIHEAGDYCLKPLLLVSLTTSIAMVPVLFVRGMGNDLQKPMAYVIIGGLTVGTFFTTWFIPLAYWYVSKWRKNKQHEKSPDGNRIDNVVYSPAGAAT